MAISVKMGEINTAGRSPAGLATSPAFSVRELAIYGDVILAPMAGFADIPTRALCRRFGSAMSYTEFVAAEDIIRGTRKASFLLDYVEADRPMVFQLFGNDPQKILRAAQRIEELGPDIIDINMGCSTRRVSGRGAGVGMMLNPKVIAETFRQLTHHLKIPVTGKIRLGWDEKQNYLEVARIMEDNGAALIAIHPRTKEQSYRETARWEAIAEVQQTVDVPVIGNGNIMAPDDIDEMLLQTGCQAVMIGRGALGNPWIFARAEKERLRFEEVTAVMAEHLEAMLAYHGQRGLILFRKHVKRYLKTLPTLRTYVQRMVTARTAEEFLDVLSAATEQFGAHTLATLKD